ncbi:hypothetical protein ACE6H2_026591 [Prunus campanulata]
MWHTTCCCNLNHELLEFRCPPRYLIVGHFGPPILEDVTSLKFCTPWLVFHASIFAVMHLESVL